MPHSPGIAPERQFYESSCLFILLQGTDGKLRVRKGAYVSRTLEEQMARGGSFDEMKTNC